MTEDCPAVSEDGRPCCYGAGHQIGRHLWARTASELNAGADSFVARSREDRLADDRRTAVEVVALALPSTAMDGTAAHAARCAVAEIERLREELRSTASRDWCCDEQFTSPPSQTPASPETGV